ncbi:1,4-dihydroxy-2-naphthoate polyprenyltransferase [Vibrio sp. SS-MA-C1-2]|uniref:1,4-dihydroxy-2-naphthoate polyprenyltransferase n=1 Tax=Vibrio sp. SS-MA-C1-2 TaxID=2908646 RepID=UPI001F308B78|nr:1,4-dihydroxy-2-naphthoate polyprenyltransferase [Vibrio sp. SS-MA-C1-2]UJF19245.1 1,4-dihydroxy-2-naphthoate polyprenyltransferase [Vibrio sp. SS-MA-C1-2]
MQSTFAIWLDAARPKTLPLAIASIITGSAIAAWQAHFSLSIAIMALITAILLQTLSNLANDYGDAVQGTDNDDRLGPQRAIQSGLITQTSMKKAIAFTIVLTIISGLYLISLAFSNPTDIFGFILLGVFAIIASITYTMGTKPYGYRGLGDISVLIFFGWLGVAGTYYLHTGYVDMSVILPATACGLLAVAVLNINNLRDIDNDKTCGKMTLIVRMGPTWGRKYHVILLSTAVICLALFAIIEIHSPIGWLFIFAIPMLIKHGRAVYQSTNGEAIRPMMGVIVKCALITNILFSIGLVLSI